MLCHPHTVLYCISVVRVQWNLYIAVTPRKQPSGCTVYTGGLLIEVFNVYVAHGKFRWDFSY